MEEDLINQNQSKKSFTPKVWAIVISVLLSISLVAIICLGIALSASDDKIAELQTDLNDVNETVAALNTKQETARSERDALQSALALAEQEAERLKTECEQLKTDLQQSIAEQESIENRLEEFEEIDQSTKAEIDRLESELENVKKEIVNLKKQLSEPEDKIRIYIDQGHNPTPYHNGGAVGNGLYEQDVTFLIGSLLAELLRNDNRFEVQLSRPNKSVVLGTDNATSIMARVEGAAEFDADYLISLHTNSFTQDSANGLEAYAAKERSESYVFGETLLNGLLEATKLKDRGMKLDPELDILEFSDMPAVLLEMGFISNSGDAALLSEHPELFAQGIYNGILDYFGFMPNNFATQ